MQKFFNIKLLSTCLDLLILSTSIQNFVLKLTQIETYYKLNIQHRFRKLFWILNIIIIISLICETDFINIKIDIIIIIIVSLQGRL